MATASSGTLVAGGLGALLPFAITATIANRSETDAYFLAIGVLFFAGTLTGLAVETVVVPYATSERLRGRAAFLGFIRAAAVRAVLWGLVATVALVAAALVILPRLSASGATKGVFHSALAAGFLIPVIAGASGVFSGASAALGRFWWVTFSQGFRALGGTLALLAVGGNWGVAAVAGGLVIGEATRAVVLATVAIRGSRQIPLEESLPLSLRPFLLAAASQVSSMVIIGLNPLVDKTVAATLSTGAITLLELSEKVFYIPVTLVSAGVGTVLGARWARQVSARMGDGLRRDFWRAQAALAAFGTITAILMIAAAWVLSGPVGHEVAPTSGRTFVIAFSCYALGLPAAFGNNVGFRMIVALRASHLLVVFSAIGLVSNIVFDIVGVKLLGAYGIALGSSAYRTITCLLVFLVADRLMRRFAAECADGDAIVRRRDDGPILASSRSSEAR